MSGRATRAAPASTSRSGPTTPSVANASTNAADISGAKGGTVVLLSGNWYIDYSTDSGATFTTLNPTTIFPNTLAGGFCCDQVLQYAPQIDRFLWLLQYQSGGTGANAYRLAMASPQDVINSNCTAWTYWDLTSASFGIGTDWMDYPSMSLGDGEVYFSFDVLDTTADGVADNGLVVVRLSLAEIAAGGTINFRFTTPADSAVAWGSGVSQDTGNEVFWAGHVDNSTLRVFSWRNDSTTYFWRDVEVRNWPNGTLSSSGPERQQLVRLGFSEQRRDRHHPAPERAVARLDRQQRRRRVGRVQLPASACPDRQAQHRRLDGDRADAGLEPGPGLRLSQPRHQFRQRGRHRPRLGRGRQPERQQRGRLHGRLRGLVPRRQHLDPYALGRLCDHPPGGAASRRCSRASAL